MVRTFIYASRKKINVWTLKSRNIRVTAERENERLEEEGKPRMKEKWEPRMGANKRGWKEKDWVRVEGKIRIDDLTCERKRRTGFIEEVIPVDLGGSNLEVGAETKKAGC